MRNNHHNEPDHSNGRIEPQLSTSAAHDGPPLLDSPIAAAPTQYRGGGKTLGLLFFLTFGIACSAAAFGWWSFERMQLLEQQLIATQDSFSQVSEDAAGRINAITGKVSEAQSSVLSGTEELNKRLSALEKSVVETQKKQQTSLTENSVQLTTLSNKITSQANQIESLNGTNKEQKEFIAQQEQIYKKALAALDAELNKSFDAQQKTLQEKLQVLEEDLTANRDRWAQLDEFNAQLKSINTDLAELKKDPVKDTASQSDVTRLQQDILILRSELDNLPAPTAAPVRKPGPSVADFDAYRAQTNRTITTLQEQVRNLQKNMR